MKFIFFLFALLLLSACGNNGGSTSKSKQVAQNEDTACNLNGNSVDCSSLDVTDGLGVDLLETTVDVAIDLSEGQVVFKETKSHIEQGRRINCQTSVKAGEVYRLSYSGSSLAVMKEDGETMNFERLNEGDSLLGAWVSRVYVDQGTHVIRQLTLVSNTRAILRTHCEL